MSQQLFCIGVILIVKLSIIIPVYRVETTLDRCVESIVGQTFHDIEVILVNDGSPDRCPQLCDDWARRDPRIRVIHKSNGGLSDARNAGIDIATGDYITFADSDDYLDVTTYLHAISELDNLNSLQGVTLADIVEFPLYRHYGAPWQKKITFDNRVYTSAADYWLQGRAYEHAYAWNKLYRRELFDGVRFPVGKVFEDVATLPLLLQKARCIATIGEGLYYYCANPQGITATAQGPQLQMLLEAHLHIMSTQQSQPSQLSQPSQSSQSSQPFQLPWLDDRYYLHVLNIQMDVCEQTGQPPTLPLRRVIPLASGLSATQRVKALTLNLLGINNLCKLNQTIHRWKKPSR